MNGNSDALFFYLVKLMRNVVIINRLKIDIESNELILRLLDLCNPKSELLG